MGVQRVGHPCVLAAVRSDHDPRGHVGRLEHLRSSRGLLRGRAVRVQRLSHPVRAGDAGVRARRAACPDRHRLVPARLRAAPPGPRGAVRRRPGATRLHELLGLLLLGRARGRADPGGARQRRRRRRAARRRSGLRRRLRPVPALAADPGLPDRSRHRALHLLHVHRPDLPGVAGRRRPGAGQLRHRRRRGAAAASLGRAPALARGGGAVGAAGRRAGHDALRRPRCGVRPDLGDAAT